MAVDDDIALINQYYADKPDAGTTQSNGATTTNAPSTVDDDIKLINDHFDQNPQPGQPNAPAPETPPSTLNKIGAGLEHGTLSVPKTIGHYGADFVAKQLDIPEDKIAASDKKYKDEEAKYQKRYGNSLIAESASIPGQILSAAPYMAVGGAAAGLGGDALSAAMPEATNMLNAGIQSSPVTRIGANIAGRLATGAGQGAAFNALTDNDVQKGAETGAAVNAIGGPLLGQGSKLVSKAIGPLVQPLTSSGREDIANKILQGYAGGPLNVNANEIIQGSKPTLAEATGNAGIAQLQDTLRDNNSKAFYDRELENHAARNNALVGASGTPQDIEAAVAQRKAEAEQALGNPEKGIPSQIFQNAQPFAPHNVNEKIDEILAGKSGNRPAVVQSMNAVKAMLNDEKGQPISDPETLYHSVRKGINDLLDKKNLTNPAGQQAAAQLTEVRDALDDSIEKGAPGFKKYLNDYSQASSPIDAMKWMQGLNLKDAQGNITLSGVQNALKNANKLQNTPGISAAKNLSSDQVNALQSIRDDLLRRQNLTAGKSFGSPTIQKATAQNKLQNVLNNSNYHLMSSRVPLEAFTAGAGATGAGLLGLSPELGALAGGSIGAGGKKYLSSKNDLIREKLQNIMLNPQSYTPPATANQAGTSLLDNPLLMYGLVPGANAARNTY